MLLRVILAHQHLLVDVDHLLGGSLPQLDALIQQDDPVAVLADIGEIMGDKEHGLPLLLELIELVVALRLKEDVSHGEGLIHDQNLRLDVDRHGEGEPHEHTRGIRLDRLIDIFPDVGKIQNRVDLLRDLLLREADHRAVQIDILNPIVLHVEARAELEERRNPAADLHVAARRIEDAGDDL